MIYNLFFINSMIDKDMYKMNKIYINNIAVLYNLVLLY